MKRIICITVMAAFLICAFAMGGCTSESSPVPATTIAVYSTQPEEPAPQGGDEVIGTPFVRCGSIEEGAERSGVDFTLSDELPGDVVQVTAYPGILLELIMEDAGRSFRLRKSIDSQDPSGDYNDFAEVNTETDGETQYTLKGNDGAVSLVLWVLDGHAYSLAFDEPVSPDIALKIAKAV